MDSFPSTLGQFKQLDSTSFDAFVDSSSPGAILFCVPEDANCDQSASVWSKISKKFPNIQFSIVDCSKSRDICLTRLHLSIIPSVLFSQNGLTFHHTESITIPRLQKWLDFLLSPSKKCDSQAKPSSGAVLCPDVQCPKCPSCNCPECPAIPSSSGSDNGKSTHSCQSLSQLFNIPSNFKTNYPLERPVAGTDFSISISPGEPPDGYNLILLNKKTNIKYEGVLHSNSWNPQYHLSTLPIYFSDSIPHFSNLDSGIYISQRTSKSFDFNLFHSTNGIYLTQHSIMRHWSQPVDSSEEFPSGHGFESEKTASILESTDGSSFLDRIFS